MAKKKQAQLSPPKLMPNPADIRALGSTGGFIRDAIGKEHRSRMSTSSSKASAARSAVKNSFHSKGKKGKP